MSHVYCPECGFQNPEAANYCARCGALLAKGEAPANVHPADWAAERAWLLLRLGEADAARMLVA